MIGSLSTPIRASSIGSIPSGIRTSALFGYKNGYFKSEMLLPGHAYWIKAGQNGKLILSAMPEQNAVNRIRIMPTLAVPPPPPDDNISPKTFSLKQAYPNPFNTSTMIRYDIPEACTVSLKIFDLLGREIDELVSGIKEQGEYIASWNASSFASGVYFYRLQAGTYSDVKKLLLMK
jgi:hypothetical protein